MATTNSDGAPFPSILNQGYMSEYFLAHRLQDGLKDLYAAWEAAERDGEPTSRTRVRSLSRAFDAHRADAAHAALVEDGATSLDAVPADALDAVRALNDASLAAFGWEPDRAAPLELVSGGREVSVPAAHVRETASGVLLVALDVVFGTDPAAMVASKAALPGTLLTPITAGDKVIASTVLEAAQVIFTADAPPTYLLFVSGGAVVLLDRERWGEGVSIGANLDEAIARADARPKGELAALAALFSADAIDPGTDAQSHLGRLLERANTEAAGVSKELRQGVRRSVELLANAVVRDVRERQHGAWQQIDADDLTRQCLRYLYRIIVLLFAEARPELAILPVDDTDYQDGYSLARLRDLALVDLQSERALNAHHIQQSLAVLFALVNEGLQPNEQLSADDRGLTFPGLHSTLFSEGACRDVDRAQIPDATMQQVFAHLCFTQPKRGQARQSLSYATLGINQLGAVYEGLMAYRGFLATEPLHEIDNDGNADNGTWVIPVTKADEFADENFVMEDGPDGQPRRVTYQTGDFVFRLAGRDRQRSASFYTPEVLTEFTVRHTLDVYWEEHPDLTAAQILELTLCEPALGSGAFANEAVNQLAARYLRAAQAERGETIDPDAYQLELQRAKAHFAINQTYGVDLNRTAVELAEVSFWLNCMHEGLEAPRFDARLRQGNSLIGARRSTYTKDQVAKAPWKGTTKTPVVPPEDVPIREVPLGDAMGIHHFLLPGEGWGAAADAVELKGKKGQPGLAEDWAAAVIEWRKKVQGKPTPAQVNRLAALSRRVEAAWAVAAKDVRSHLDAHRRPIKVWGAEPTGGDALAGSTRFNDPNGATARLRLLMDACCALWMCAPANGTDLPNFDRWLDAAEGLFGQASADEAGTLFEPNQDGTSEAVELFGKERVEQVLEKHPWLQQCRTIAERQAFFHWELDFAPVFGSGGFDVQVGNPPWARPRWVELDALAELDPFFGLWSGGVGDSDVRARIDDLLTTPDNGALFAADRAEAAAIAAVLSAQTREPLLVGIQTNLYMVFMTSVWRRQAPNGVIGLIHQEAHLVDPAAGRFRSVGYRRLRRHWRFQNKLRLFGEVHDETIFGVFCSGESRDDVSFLQASGLLHPRTVDGSIDHDGSGVVPGMQFEDGAWDLRPHIERVIHVDDTVLATWARLFDREGTRPDHARIALPSARIDLQILDKYGQSRRRLRDVPYEWSGGFYEDKFKTDGTARREMHEPTSASEVVLQSAHIVNGAWMGQQPRPDYRSNNDWVLVDLEQCDRDFLPRALYTFNVSMATVDERDEAWASGPANRHVRSVHREYVQPGSVRTLQSAIAPKGVRHINSVVSVRLSSLEETVLWSALLTSLPLDYLVKMAGVTHVNHSVFPYLPFPEMQPLLRDLTVHRAMCLNALTSALADEWSSLWRPSWANDRCEVWNDAAILSNKSSKWSLRTAARSDAYRWAIAVEIDAIAALALGFALPELTRMYEAMFRTLRRYESETLFAANGLKVTRDHNAFGAVQAAWEAQHKSVPLKRGEKRMGMWERVQRYMAGETDIDLGPFEPPFTPADREAAMTQAYKAFEQRLADA